MKNTLEPDSENNVRYNDLYVRLLITLTGAHYIVSFGEPESFFELLLMWDYQRSLLFSWVIGFLIVSLIRWITLKLDAKLDWQQKTAVRILLQALLGIGGLSIIAFLLATGYFALHNMNILHTEYLMFDFPVIILMLMLVNFYYFIWYVYVKWNSSKKPTSSTTYKQVIIVQHSAKNIPIKIDNVSYFHRSSEVNFLRTQDGTDYIITDSLDYIESQIDPSHFFRSNRQFIVSFSACERFETIENDKLELFVNPVFKERIIISQKKAPDFRKWIEK